MANDSPNNMFSAEDPIEEDQPEPQPSNDGGGDEAFDTDSQGGHEPGDEVRWTASWGTTYRFRIPSGRQAAMALDPKFIGGEQQIQLMKPEVLQLVEANTKPDPDLDSMNTAQVIELTDAFVSFLF